VSGTNAKGHWSNIMFMATSCIAEDGFAVLNSVTYSSWSRWKNKYHNTDNGFSYNCEEFWNEIAFKCTKKGKLIVIGYDIGNSLALCSLWEKIEDGILKWEGGAINTPPFVVNVTFKGRMITFIDVLNYYDENIDNIVSRALQVKPMSCQFNNRGEENVERTQVELSAVETVIFDLIKMHDEKGWGEVKNTGPACAYNVYRHKYYDVPYYTHDNSDALKIERDSYYGGRCQIFRVQSFFEPTYHLDINSAYPYVMKTRDMPFRLASSYECIGKDSLRALLIQYLGCAHVCVNSFEYPYPVKVDGQTIFAHGKFWTYLCGDELKRALDMGHVEHVANASIYHKEKLFTRYVDDIYGEKLSAKISGDKHAEGTAKMMLNSLYGKFAQKTALWIDVRKIIAPQAWGHYWEDVPGREGKVAARSIAYNVQIQSEQEEKEHSSPIISACITSALRVYLWELILICGIDNVYYTDTDSIHCNEDGMERLRLAGKLHDYELGKMKVECEYSAVQYFGPKRYVVDDTIVLAGLKKNARKGKENNWHFDILERTPSIIARRPDGTVRYWPKSVSMEEPSFSGKLLDDGRLLPPVLE
jgi:hypothetical protein